MRTFRQQLVIERDINDVFDLIADTDRYPDFFVGMTRWRQLSDQPGPDARYRMLMKVGSIEAGGTVRITEWAPPEDVAWEWEQGLHQWGRWRLRKVPGGTELALEVSIDLSGGPVGDLVERVAGRILTRNLRATLLAARRLLEEEA